MCFYNKQMISSASRWRSESCTTGFQGIRELPPRPPALLCTDSSSFSLRPARAFCAASYRNWLRNRPKIQAINSFLRTFLDSTEGYFHSSLGGREQSLSPYLKKQWQSGTRQPLCSEALSVLGFLVVSRFSAISVYWQPKLLEKQSQNSFVDFLTWLLSSCGVGNTPHPTFTHFVFLRFPGVCWGTEPGAFLLGRQFLIGLRSRGSVCRLSRNSTLISPTQGCEDSGWFRQGFFSSPLWLNIPWKKGDVERWGYRGWNTSSTRGRLSSGSRVFIS